MSIVRSVLVAKSSLIGNRNCENWHSSEVYWLQNPHRKPMFKNWHLVFANIVNLKKGIWQHMQNWTNDIYFNIKILHIHLLMYNYILLWYYYIIIIIYYCYLNISMINFNNHQRYSLSSFSITIEGGGGGGDPLHHHYQHLFYSILPNLHSHISKPTYCIFFIKSFIDNDITKWWKTFWWENIRNCTVKSMPHWTPP